MDIATPKTLLVKVEKFDNFKTETFEIEDPFEENYKKNSIDHKKEIKNSQPTTSLTVPSTNSSRKASNKIKDLPFTTLKCSECPFETKRKQHFKTHQKTHNVVPIFKCSNCDYETTWKTEFKKHRLTHLDTKKLKCPECSYETNAKGDLRQHIRSHSASRKLKCSECSYETRWKHILSQHKIVKHGSNLPIIKCCECTYTTNNQRYFDAHLRVMHSVSKILKCAECTYVTKRKRALKFHIQKHLGTVVEKCPHCSYVTHRNDTLRKHMSKHSETKPFRCFDCGFETSWKSYFSKHLSSHTKAKEGPQSISNKISACNQFQWDYEKNMYLLESYFIGKAIPQKRASDLLRLETEKTVFHPIDYMACRFQKRYGSAIDRINLAERRRTIMFNISRKRKSVGRTSTLPSMEDVNEIEKSIQKFVEDNIELNAEMIEDIKRMKALSKIKRRKQAIQSKGDTGKEEGLAGDLEMVDTSSSPLNVESSAGTALIGDNTTEAEMIDINNIDEDLESEIEDGHDSINLLLLSQENDEGNDELNREINYDKEFETIKPCSPD